MSAGGHAVRRLKSNPATPGNALVMSIDIRLQALVEELFGDRRGALVAIDPSNGEMLAFVSKPNFDPNLFVDGIDVENWQALNESPDKPLLNRALRGTYPPGSTYKPFMALAALTLGKRTPQQTIFDPGYYNFGNHRFRDDKEGGHGTVDMYKSIVQSCDTYYYMLANDLGVDAMHDFMAPLGFGRSPASTCRASCAARCRRPSGSATPTARRKRRSGTPARRSRSASARATTLHDAAAGAGDGHRRRRRPALHAAPGERGRELRDPRVAASSATALPRAATGSPSTSPSSTTRLRRDPGRHVGALVRQRAVQVGRQDRHRAGDRHQGQTRSTTPRGSTSAIATTRSTPPSRRSSAAHRARDGGRERRLRRRRGGADRAPRLRLRALRRSTRARPTSRRPSSASRPRRSACRGRSTPCRCRARPSTARRRRAPTPAPRPLAAAGARRRGVAPLTGRAPAAASRCGATAMSAVFEQPVALAAARPVFTGFDGPLLAVVLLLAIAGLVTMYSAGFDYGTRFVDHGRNMLLALGVLFLVAQISPQTLMKLAIPLYVVGVVAAGRDGAAGAGHHAEGRDALAQRRRRRSSRARS